MYGITVFSDGFEGGTFGSWDGNGATSWQIGTTGSGGYDPHAGTYDAWCDPSHDGTLTSDDIDLSRGGSVSVTFWMLKDDIEPADFYLYFYNGTAYTLIVDLDTLGGDDVWIQYSSGSLDSQYFVSNFRIRFGAWPDNNENVYVDDVAVARIPPNLPIRPEGVGTYSGWTDYPAAGDNWDKVDDTGEGDGVSTYVYVPFSSGVTLDTYETEDLQAVGAYYIEYVQVYFRARRDSGASAARIAGAIYTHSARYNGSWVDPATTYTLYNTTWYTNPYTGASWTAAEVDALEIGVRGNNSLTGGALYCTQVYCNVSYEVYGGGNWLTGWNYRKAHRLNATSGAGTGYQFNMTVHYGSGTDSRFDVYIGGGKCQADFDDIRITSVDGSTLLDVWRENKSDGDYARIWYEVVEDISSVDTFVFVYYNNSAASWSDSGADTFLFFDDFDTFDTGVWSGATGSYSASGGDLTTSSSGTMVETEASGFTMTDAAIETRVRLSAATTRAGFGGRSQNAESTLSSSDQYFATARPADASPDIIIVEYNDAGDSVLANTAKSFSTSVYYRATFSMYGSNLTHTFNGTAQTATDASWSSGYVSVGTGTNTGSVYWSWIAVRKYVWPEPVQGQWFEEEAAPSLAEVLGGSSGYTEGEAVQLYVNWTCNEVLRFYTLYWNATGSWAAPNGTIAFSTTWSNVSQTLPETPLVAVAWRIQANSTEGNYVNSTTRYIYVLNDVPEVMEEDWGEDIQFNQHSRPIYVNGSRDAFYLAYLNTTTMPYWNMSIIGYNTASRQWSVPHDFGAYGLGAQYNDPHYVPTIGLLPNGSLIIVKGYGSSMEYKLTQTSALTATNITTLLETWTASWQTVNGTGGAFSSAYPTLLHDSSTTPTALRLFSRNGSAGGGDFCTWLWNSGAGRFDAPTIIVDGSTVGRYFYPYPTMVNSTHILMPWNNETAVYTPNALYFAYSDDFGVTWYNASGTTLTLPVNCENATVKVNDDPAWRTLGAVIDENQKCRILYSIIPEYPFNSIPQYMKTAVWSSTLGSPGSWATSNVTDMNGDTLVNSTANFEVVVFFDTYYNRTSFWVGRNDSLVKYVGWTGSTTKYIAAYNDTTADSWYWWRERSIPILFSYGLFEVLNYERLQSIGLNDLQATHAPDGYAGTTAQHTYATKFTATHTGNVKEITAKVNATGILASNIEFRAAVYALNGTRLGYTSSSFELTANWGYWYYCGWSMVPASLAVSASVTEGETYYLAVKFTHDIRLYNVSAAANASCHYNDGGGMAMPETLVSVDEYAVSYFIVGFEIHAVVRGIDQTPPTPLGVGWNQLVPWAADVGKTLMQIVATINFEGVHTTYAIKNNDTEYLYTRGWDDNALEIIDGVWDNLTVYCTEDGVWYHTYDGYNWLARKNTTTTFTLNHERAVTYTRMYSATPTFVMDGGTTPHFLFFTFPAVTVDFSPSALATLFRTLLVNPVASLMFHLSTVSTLFRTFFAAPSFTVTFAFASLSTIFSAFAANPAITLLFTLLSTPISTGGIVYAVAPTITLLFSLASTLTGYLFYTVAPSATLTFALASLSRLVAPFTNPVWIIGYNWIIGANWLYNGITGFAVSASATITFILNAVATAFLLRVVAPAFTLVFALVSPALQVLSMFHVTPAIVVVFVLQSVSLFTQHLYLVSPVLGIVFGLASLVSGGTLVSQQEVAASAAFAIIALAIALAALVLALERKERSE